MRNWLAAGHPLGHFAVPTDEVFTVYAPRHFCLNWNGPSAALKISKQIGVLHSTTRVISSDENKALETAIPIANALGVTVEVRPHMHENDRSSTGFLTPSEIEDVADQFFSSQTESVRGWEKAIEAQRRIML